MNGCAAVSPPYSTSCADSAQYPNLECFITRIGEHPERLQNAYFAYVVMARALSKGSKALLQPLDAIASKGGLDLQQTREEMLAIVDSANSCGTTFDETSMFAGPQAAVRSVIPQS